MKHKHTLEDGTEIEFEIDVTSSPEYLALQETYDELNENFRKQTETVNELTKQNGKLILQIGDKTPTDEELFSSFNKYKKGDY